MDASVALSPLSLLASEIDAGDTAWMLAATALVLMMTPALGLFYAGLVRSKNTLNTFMMCVAALAVATISWAAIGYSLAFSEGNGFIGGLDYAFLSGVGLRAARGADDPAPAVLRLPGDVLHHHRGAGLRRRRRAHALRPVPDLHRDLERHDLPGARALGVRRRLAADERDARLRRRRPGRDGLRLLGARGRAGRRRPARLRPPGAAPAQRRLRAARSGAALVRLVRVQRRQRSRRDRDQHAGVRQHAALPGLHPVRLVHPRPDPRPPRDRDRRRHRDRRRLRRDHAGGRLHQPRLGDGARCARGATELRDDRLPHAHARRRDPRRARRARHRGHDRDPLHRVLRPGGLERDLGRADLRERGPARRPGRGGARRHPPTRSWARSCCSS